MKAHVMWEPELEFRAGTVAFSPNDRALAAGDRNGNMCLLQING